MRTTTAILFATVLGLSSSAFAATPTDTAAREARMSEALKSHRAATASATGQAEAGKATVSKKHQAAKKRTAKKHASAVKSTAPIVKATPASTK
jgi:hypothetical protein